MSAVAAQTQAALRDAARDARAAWRPWHPAALGVFAAACALPWFAPAWVRIDELAGWIYLALAATGLVLTVGFAGLPSLGQGAFMSIGAFATGLLAARAGWPVEATIPAAVAASLVGGALTGIVLIRLAPLFLAVSTWILTWLVVLVALAFPGISGGAQGYVVPSRLDPTGHYELALALTALALVVVVAVARSSIGLRLRAHRDRAAAASSLGVRSDRLLLGAFAASAAVGGLAGSLAVQLSGVTDPNAFGPVVSFKLLAAVLLGGVSYASAGAAGVAVLGTIALVARAWVALQGGSSAEVQPMLDAMFLLAVLSLGGQGLIPLLARLRRHLAPPAPAPGPAPSRRRRAPGPARLSARGLTKHYGGVHALAGFDLEVAPGEAVALVGANGSGKTTALRALAGALPLDSGEIALDGRPHTGCSVVEMAEAGVVRTLQRTATFQSLTSLENVVVGAALRARHSSALRVATATPKSRAEERELRSAALDALVTVGLAEAAYTQAELLDGFQQRLLMLATALATRPTLLLLDEPLAGAAAAEIAGLAAVLADVRAMGISLVVVEHNLDLVRAVADRTVTMVDGRSVDASLP